MKKYEKSATWREWILEKCKILLHWSMKMDNGPSIDLAESGIKTNIQVCLK